MNRPSPKPKPRKKGNKGKNDESDLLPTWVMIFLIIIVTLTWLFTVIVGVINPKYHAPDQVNTLFVGVMGALVLNTARRRKKDDDEDE